MVIGSVIVQSWEFSNRFDCTSHGGHGLLQSHSKVARLPQRTSNCISICPFNSCGIACLSIFRSTRSSYNVFVWPLNAFGVCLFYPSRQLNMRVLCVAEKPSIARSITDILSGGRYETVSVPAESGMALC
jgi:hypothetical protein